MEKESSVNKIRRFDGVALGARIKLLREIRGMTLQQVADASGIAKTHVWELEAGRSINPTVNAVWGLAEAFTVSPGQLLGLSEKGVIMSNTAARIAGIVDRELNKAIKESAWGAVQVSEQPVQS